MFLDDELKQEIAFDVQKNVFRRIRNMNNELELKNFLKIIEMEELFPTEVLSFIPGREIYVVGESTIKDNVVIHIFKSLGIEVQRIKIVKGYEELVNFNYEKLRNEIKIAAIFVGPIPHSVKGKGNHSSIISKMEQEEGFPQIVRLMNNNDLKITKSNLREKIADLLENNLLDRDN